jgi:hypothetical protein
VASIWNAGLHFASVPLTGRYGYKSQRPVHWTQSWKGAFVTRAVGGYGRSGWIWETDGGAFATVSRITSRP